MIIEGSRVVGVLFFAEMELWCILIFCQGTESDLYVVHELGIWDVKIFGGRLIDSIAYDDPSTDIMSIFCWIHLKS